MTSVTSTQNSAVYQAQRPPPPPPSDKKTLSQTIASDVSAGTISATDGTALTSALDSIDASLASGRTGGSTAATRLDPSQVKSKIDGLIDDQVSGGTLTSDQADTLKQLFAANAPAKGGGHGPHGPGGPGQAPPSDDDSDTTATSATSSTGSASDVGAILDNFLKVLQTSQASASGYAASGSSSTNASSSALLFDFDT